MSKSKLHMHGISKIDSFFLNCGFTRNENESTFYLKTRDNGDFLVVCLFLDYMIYMGSSKSLFDNFKSCKMRNLEMTNLSLLQYFLRIEVKQG